MFLGSSKRLCDVSRRLWDVVAQLWKSQGCFSKAPENSGTSLEGGHIYWRMDGLRIKDHLEYMLGCKGCTLKAISRKASAECAKR